VTSVIRPAVSEVVSDSNLESHDLVISVFKYFNACLLITAIQTFQWIGWWNALTMYLWPWADLELARDGTFICVGVLLIFISNKFFSLEEIREEMLEDWRQGVPKTFSWGRKIRNFAKKVLNFAAFVTTWVGAWNIFDSYLLQQSLYRDLAYVFLPLILGLIVEEFLSTESIYYLIVKCTNTETDEIWLPPENDIENQNLVNETRTSFNKTKTWN